MRIIGGAPCSWLLTVFACWFLVLIMSSSSTLSCLCMSSPSLDITPVVYCRPTALSCLCMSYSSLGLLLEAHPSSFWGLESVLLISWLILSLHRLLSCCRVVVRARDPRVVQMAEGGAAFGAACVAAAGFAYQSVMGSHVEHKADFRFPRRAPTSTQLPGEAAGVTRFQNCRKDCWF